MSGAFDKVGAERLISKLGVWCGVGQFLDVVARWMQEWTANVVLGGGLSRDMVMRDMVYQGTVLGPCLWNIFCHDARGVLQDLGFTDVTYADNLNAFKCFPSGTPSRSVLHSLGEAPSTLHRWGVANRVTFNAGKESMHIVSRREPYREVFVFWVFHLTANFLRPG